MKDAMQECGYSEKDIVYINAHGTGTPMNDAVETAVIKKALGDKAAHEAYVSSTKSMTGHMFSGLIMLLSVFISPIKDLLWR